MEEKQSRKEIKKVKLNYMSAVSRTSPKAQIPVSSAKMEELDRAIREKIEHNKSEYNRMRDTLEDVDHIVK